MAGMDVKVGLFGSHSDSLIFRDGVASVFDEDFDGFFVFAGANGDGALFGAQDGALEVGGEFVFELALVDIYGERGVDKVEIEGDFFALAERESDFV